MTTPPEGTQPPTGPRDPHADPYAGPTSPPPQGPSSAPGEGYAPPPYAPPPSAAPYAPPPAAAPYGPPPGGPYGAPPAGAYGPPPGQGTPGAPQDDRGTDVVSIVGLVLAFLLAPVGLVLSIIGLTRTAGGRRKGRGLAVAGVIVSVVMSLVLAAGVVALVALGRFVADEGSVAFDELEDAFPTAEPFPGESFPADPFPTDPLPTDPFPTDPLPDDTAGGVDPASLLPLGGTADLDGLLLTVTAVDLDADAEVAAESADNPPPSGRYVLVTGTVQNTTEQPQEPYFGLNVGYQSAAGSLYDEFTCSATVAGAAVDVPPVDPGASVEIRWCLDVPAEELVDGSVQVAASGSGTTAAWADR